MTFAGRVPGTEEGGGTVPERADRSAVREESVAVVFPVNNFGFRDVKRSGLSRGLRLDTENFRVLVETTLRNGIDFGGRGQERQYRVPWVNQRVGWSLDKTSHSPTPPLPRRPKSLSR